ncbi:hypothetical protein A2334_00175 [Candidatus Roizmanbacteria bacterium RIFOXYB2_FULL_38_10]|uniref:Uncharacterized protein n=1 Tax=Candidatus Roizmanbacteria bacterium RIFOXYD1_FULL_38_12 TaxID=1802093 RepID=A0A1F7L2H5_9BACT|nr:MAG: hypothetical protein A3K47_05720 [Candidatus Roizmanbacteria bacterium RIFOXYA2_FULL_38_14]OGK64241.1 MAG: hypothetical protein A3K27_05720 [Candidatus Roizmanbacteria bacterium RIFOXYA1_FULL_37_12]OGK66087.1 MAG: hypothetical protein A3K38_05720 [Candidatus Roizmanbacteria bacterium RIFOXYB1_FULL_40_23]OGK67652.1 MAG: hypothetical protein A2334_00175 [Candidatus Roizmanbacteria bacterium RIFOXYB2_FULL_38_10]OGK70492.1 MAG: hypothetical protein A3K21_05725 [Candidatus Roizmanbacteria ba
MNQVLIKVKVQPQSSKDFLIKKSEDQFEIGVKEKPEQGAANQKVKMILSAYFHVSPQAIRLLKGGKKPSKIFEISKYT